MSTKNHPYHIVDPSPWPIATSFILLFVVLSALGLIKEIAFSAVFFTLSIALLILVLALWWRDVIDETLVQKQHTKQVISGIKIGVVLFIISEVAFFGAFFGSIFKNKLLPNKGLEGFWAEKVVSWVPESFSQLDPWNLPFTNTLILLLSGTTLCWAEHAMSRKNTADVLKGLKYTIILGFCFTCLQAFEYIHAPFKLSESVFTSDFYIVTGFHGAHVIIGTIFLSVCYVRAALGHFDDGRNHLGFEFAVWYWHFVDVVWLLLFVFLYLWS